MKIYIILRFYVGSKFMHRDLMQLYVFDDNYGFISVIMGFY